MIVDRIVEMCHQCETFDFLKYNTAYLICQYRIKKGEMVLKTNHFSPEQVLESFYKDNAEAPTPDMIIDETAKYYNLTSEDLKGNSHVKNFVTARHVSMYIIRQLTNLSLSEIGSIFGGKDHTTVLNACRKIEKECKQDVDLSNTIRDITSNINSRN